MIETVLQRAAALQIFVHSAGIGASYVTGHVLAVDGGFLAAGVLNKYDVPQSASR